MLVRASRKNEAGQYEWVFGRGFSSYKKEQAQIEQDITSALLEFKNDAFWALDHGIDWKTRMGYTNQKKLLDFDIITVIQNRFGVLSVQDFVSNVIDRVYTAQCNVFTIYSEIPLNYTFTMAM